jgi:hypothetical protein
LGIALEQAVVAFDAALAIFVPGAADYYTRICRTDRETALALISARGR